MSSVPNVQNPDRLVRQLQQWLQSPTWTIEYADVLGEIAKIVEPPGGALLYSSIIATLDLVEHVPWLLDDLSRFSPGIGKLAQLTEKIGDRGTADIPGKGFSQHRVLVALRRLGGAKPHDRPLRALVLALAARKQTLPPGEQHSAAVRCIETISIALGGLYHSKAVEQGQEQEPESPLLQLLASCADAQSIGQYVEQLRTAFAKHPEAHHDLELRVRRDLFTALGLENCPVAPHGPLPGGNYTKGYELPEDLGDPDPPTIQIPLDPIDPSTEPEPDEESRPSVVATELEGKAGKPFSIPELLEAARVAARPQNIAHRNDILLDLHVDVLTEPEAKLLAPEIIRAGLALAKVGDTDSAVQLGIAALSLALGYESQRAAALLTAKPNRRSPYLSPDRKTVISPALQPPNAFAPKPKDRQKFVKTAQWIHIPLPPPVVTLLDALPWNEINWAKVAPLHPYIGRALGPVCRNLGLYSVTKGRLRRTCSARLFSFSKDLSAVMHLARDTFGSSIGSMYYCSFNEGYLQQIFRGAIWSIWDCQPEEEGEKTITSRIGSKGLVRKDYARKLSHSIGAAFQRGIPTEPDRQQLVQIHKTLMLHVTGMLMAVVGHRPVDSLFSLTAHDLDLEYKGAIFRDKKIDAAHSHRLVALGSLVSEQLSVYMVHLAALSVNLALPLEARKAATAALRGQGPLFFSLSKNALAEDMLIGRWKELAPSLWHRVPTNWGRHYLASHGRELKVTPVLLHIQLGHLESAGYPFSPDSPMEPLQFLKQMGEALDDVYRMQGWSCRRAGHSGAWRDDWTTIGHLRRWENDLTQSREKAKAERRELRHQYRARQQSIRARAEVLVMQQAGEIKADLGELIAFRINQLRYRRSPIESDKADWGRGNSIADVECPEHVAASFSEISTMLDSLDDRCKHDQAFAIATRNTIARCLRWAARKRVYSGFIPGFIVLRRPVDPSPFLPAHMQATRQVRLLRDLCKTLLLGGQIASENNTSSEKLGALVLTIIVHGGVESRAYLDALRSADSTLLGVPALNDAILVARPTGVQVGLRQIAALCFAILHRDFVSKETLSLDEIESALSEVLPDEAKGSGSLLDAILETMHICNRVERSGLENFALDGKAGCVPFVLDRLMEMLGHRPESAPSSPDVVIKPPPPLPKTQARSEYQQIKRCWPNKNHAVELPITGQIVELKRRQYPSRKRRVYDELVAKSYQGERSFLGRTMAGWLAWELINREPNGQSFREYGGIYSGYTEVCKRLVVRAGEFADDLDPSELEDLYLDMVQSSATTNARRIAREIKNYHQYLITYHGAHSMSFARIMTEAGSAVDGDEVIDNQIVLPAEQNTAMALIERNAAGLTGCHGGEPAELRILYQVFLIFALMMATGGRIKEILGLQRRDIILLPKQIYVVVRSTGYTKVKTKSARRLIALDRWMDPRLCKALREWIGAEESMGFLGQAQNLVFADISNEPLNPYVVRKVLSAGYSHASLQALKNHHNRHTALCNLHSQRRIGIGLAEFATASNLTAQEPVLQLPWDLQRDTRQFGHSRPRTGVRCYTHVPWVFSLRAQSDKQHRIDRHALAACLGVSLSAADNRLRERGAEAAAAGRAIRAITRIVEPASTAPKIKPNAEIYISRRGPRLSEYLAACARGVPSEDAARALGIQEDDVVALRTTCTLLTDKSDIELIPGYGRASTEGRSTPRWYGDSRGLQRIWEAVETGAGDSQLWIRVAEDWFTHRRRSDHGIIRLPESSAARMKSLLARAGYECKTESDPQSDAVKRCLVSHASSCRGLNSILAWVLAIAWAVHSAQRNGL